MTTPSLPQARSTLWPRIRRVGTLALLVTAGVFIAQRAAPAAEGAFAIAPPAVDQAPATVHSETAVFAGGCFWGVQGVFQHVRGVTRAVSGYSGGSSTTAHYEIVGSGMTGHAESVEVTFDPTQITYGQLLQIYFSVVQDPTQLNRQGPDSGTQYRSTVFAKTADQRKVAQSYIAQLDKSGVYPSHIVTTIEDYKAFYPAEAYHQDFLTLHPDYPYIAVNDIPKVENMKRMYPTLYRDAPVLVTARK